MVFGFGKKKKEAVIEPSQEQPAQEPNAPTLVDYILSMRQQGLSNDQIIQNLQRMGYNSTQIFDSINQADTNIGAPPQPMHGVPEAPSIQPRLSTDQEGSDSESEKEKIDEMVEAIIDEKWTELTKNTNKLFEWKDQISSKINEIEQQIKGLKENFDRLHSAILGKITEYDQNIVNVGTEVKAMEKVFKKILPAFTENVNELSRITKNIKKPQK